MKLFKELGLYLSFAWIAACSSTSQQALYWHANLTQGEANFLAKNYSLAYKQLMPYAVRGNRDAEYAIGYMYYFGKGVIRNEEIGSSWLHRAAAKGHTLAKVAITKR